MNAWAARFQVAELPCFPTLSLPILGGARLDNPTEENPDGLAIPIEIRQLLPVRHGRRAQRGDRGAPLAAEDGQRGDRV